MGVIRSPQEAAGSIKAWGGASIPAGWLDCDGSAVSRTTYAALFAAIGTAYGVGNGTTTFNVPDLRGRSLLGAGTGSGLTARTKGQTGGAETHALSAAEGPIHDHSTAGSAGGGYAQPGSFTGATSDMSAGSPYLVGQSGSGTSHNNMQPFGVANYIIKA